jgi:thioredoxin 1
MKTKPLWGRIAVAACIVLFAVYAFMQTRGQSATPETASPADQTAAFTLAAGRVTMIDLGATECVPCKMMAPIIEELKKEYTGKADIIFIDVWKNPDQARKYGIRAIPTQIFYDAEGKEVHRNVGFMDKKRIVDVLTRLGVS